MMRAIITILATLLAATGAFAQQDRGSPFTAEEAQTLRQVWPQIREAAAFEDIDWRTVGLSRAPGDSQARKLMATHWGTLRNAGSFDDINWQSMTGYRGSAATPFERYEEGPFTRPEAEALERVWPEIRQAAAYEDINWQALGLSRPPGDREARERMARHWDSVRRHARFSDIDWSDIDYATSRDFPTSRALPRDESWVSGPFTRDEAELLDEVWPQIRQASHYEDVNWQALGLRRAPGDRDAQRLMATHWDSVRRAADFDDIDWEATTGYRPR
jgi:hypothetical protein